jgi:hypothetical protein
MLESFLTEIRNKGKIRVLSSSDAHTMINIVVGPVITRDNKIGVQFQDKASGKHFMIEVGSTKEEVMVFLENVKNAFLTASETNDIFHKILKDKADAKTSRG